MSMTEDDAAQDEFIDEVSREAVENFKHERLVAYFLENPNLATPARWALEEAQLLLRAYPSAAHVFAVAAIEVCVKAAMLKPMIHGFVHHDAAAGLLAEAVLKQTGSLERFQALLFAIMAEHGGIDLKTYIRPGATSLLWSEIKAIQDQRNAVVHRAQPVTPSQAESAVAVARHLLSDLFPQLASRVGVQVLSTSEVCSVWDPRATRESARGPAA